MLTDRAPVQTGQLSNSAPSQCLMIPRCPGVTDHLPRRYHAYRFVNGEASACISVRLTLPPLAPRLLFSAAYLDEFRPDKPCANFLGTLGQTSNESYAFIVPPRRRFVVVVSQHPSGSVPVGGIGYRLEVSGGSCPPCLEIAETEPGQVVLGWSSTAPEYQLQATPTLNPPQFVPVPAEPVVVDGRCTVTNPVSVLSRFYRLRAEQ